MVANIASLLVPVGELPKVDNSWLDKLATSGGDVLSELGARKSFNGFADRIGGQQATAAPQAGFLSRLMGGGAQQQAQPMTAPVGTVGRAPIPATDQMAAYRDAIAGIESKGSGDYSAIGPTDPKMGRALGRYQVMEANIGPWSKEVLGREVTPQEFIQSPEIQDAVFNGKFNGYVQQYGPEGAAQAWFGGPGSVGKGDRKDVLGTSVSEYGNRFMQAAGNPPAVDAVNAMASGQPIGAPAAQPMPVNQVADSSGQTLAPAVTPVQRGGVDPSLIQSMLRDPNLREYGMKLWEANAVGQKPSEPWQFVNLPDGTLARANQQTGEIQKVGQFAKPQELPNSYQEFQLAQKSGFQGTYADWEKVKQPGVTVNNVPGENSTAKAAGEGLGKLFSGIFDQGLSANQDKANVSLLRSSLANSPTGVMGGIASLASDYGVNLGPNADQVQVAKSIIAKMVPAQRVPGSGTTSDRDLAMFQDALPRLSGDPKGNAIILDTMDALANLKTAQADIVTKFYAGEIDQKAAVKQLQALPDPFTAYKSFAGKNGGTTQLGTPTPMTDAEYEALPSGTIYTDPEDKKQYRKP